MHPRPNFRIQGSELCEPVWASCPVYCASGFGGGKGYRKFPIATDWGAATYAFMKAGSDKEAAKQLILC